MNFRREILRKCVAQISLYHGWDAVTSSALDALVHILEHYLLSVARRAHSVAEYRGHQELTLQDMLISFNDYNINLSELSEYTTAADHAPLPINVPYFPAPRLCLNKTVNKPVSKTCHLDGDNQTSLEKRQNGGDNLSSMKNIKLFPEEAEASQYEMKSFNMISLESGDLKAAVQGRAPNSKIRHELSPELEDNVFKPPSKNLISNLHSAFGNKSPALESSNLEHEVFDYKSPKTFSSLPEPRNEKKPNRLKQILNNQSAAVAIIAGLKKHRKPTIKEAFIAKKKQNKSAKLAAVKVDLMEVNYTPGSEVKKKRPGRKPKKIPKSKTFVSDVEELKVAAPQDISSHKDADSKSKEKCSDSILEVINTVAGETLVSKDKDVTMDDMELGTMNDEILVDIADKEGDSPLLHLTGMVHNSQGSKGPLSDKEAKNDLLPIKDNNVESHINIDVEEEILPWSDEELIKNGKNVSHSDAHKATGLELILGRNQGDEVASFCRETEMESPSFLTLKKNQKNNREIRSKEKKKEKKSKKLKKEKNLKEDDLLKEKKVHHENDGDTKIKVPLDNSIVHQESIEKVVTDKPKKVDTEKYSICKKIKQDEHLGDMYVSDDAYQNNRKEQQMNEWNDVDREEFLPKKKKMPLQMPNSEHNAFEKPRNEFHTGQQDESSFKKKKKKGKRKLEDFDESEPCKSKKFKKESFESPTIPKLTLKFGGTTVCGGAPSFSNIRKDNDPELPSKISAQAPIKLVIKPFSNVGIHPSPKISSQHQSRLQVLTEKHRFKSRSPSPPAAPTFSPSPDRLSIPSMALSSRSPSPNDMARLASGPSNRKNVSPIYSESPSPPAHREEQSFSRSVVSVSHKKQLSSSAKSKSKELNTGDSSTTNKQKSSANKPAPTPKSSGSKNSKTAIISETVGKITKANGEIIWICPTCGCPDSGTPMIGCDRCDDWYHWVCVNIVKEPPAEMNWYCVRCKNQNPSLKSQVPGKRGRPAGKGKSKK